MFGRQQRHTMDFAKSPTAGPTFAVGAKEASSGRAKKKCGQESLSAARWLRTNHMHYVFLLQNDSADKAA